MTSKTFRSNSCSPLSTLPLKLRWKIISATPSMRKQINQTSATDTLKRPSAVTQAILRSPPQETVMVTLNLHSCASIKPVLAALMTRSYFTTGIALRLALRASVSQTLADPRSYAKGQTTTEIVESIKELYD